ncbi:maleate cis-trans isomerase family protein [Phreatobacter sp.]|uniref:maleate cis-trans isomerase family protein n=1 Tax=Phreatobacter sp. TaxID=1966341 RepID=UPI003F72C121
MTPADNWGHAARIGIFVVAREVVPEAEWWAMRPAGVSVHAARVAVGAPWAPWRADRQGVDLPDDLARGLAAFRDIQASVAVLAHSSSSFVGGAGWDEAVVAAMATHLAPGTVATTNGLDLRLAMAHLGIARPFLVMPAWMPDRTIADAVAYLAAYGLEVASAARHVPPPPWQAISPQNLYAEGMAIAQETQTLLDQVCRSCPPDADGVLLAGTGLRCSGIIEAIEQAVGRPVVAANQASLWRALRASGVATPVEGYGRLLRS